LHFKIYLEVELGLNVKKKVSQKKVLQFNGFILTTMTKWCKTCTC